MHASLETAAVGPRLSEVLESRVPGHLKVQRIREVVDWLVAVAHETAGPAELLEAERRRMKSDMVRHWTSVPHVDHVVDRVPSIQSVFQHNDLGSWNIHVASGGFTALDWEDAREHGFPLWDVLYFLADALACVDGARSPDGRTDHFVRLFRGELESSQFLGAVVRRALDASAAPADAAGPLATLCWLQQAIADRARRRLAELRDPGSAGGGALIEQLAAAWLTTPGLGVDWTVPP